MRKKILKTAAALTLVMALTAPMTLNVLAAQVAIPPDGTITVQLVSQNDSWDPWRTGNISVNGNGVVKADPDMAVVQVGVNLRGATAKEAQTEVAEKINAIVKAVVALGVDEKDIQTTGFWMWPEYDWNQMHMFRDVHEPVLIGYTITHSLNLTVRDIDVVGDVIEAATDAGANQNNGVFFDIENRDELYIEALALAIADAKKKAEALAEILEVEVGAPVSVSESYSYFDPWRSFSGSGYPMAMADSGVRLQTGQIEVTAAVFVNYMYER